MFRPALLTISSILVQFLDSEAGAREPAVRMPTQAQIMRVERRIEVDLELPRPLKEMVRLYALSKDGRRIDGQLSVRSGVHDLKFRDGKADAVMARPGSYAIGPDSFPPPLVYTQSPLGCPDSGISYELATDRLLRIGCLTRKTR